MNIRTQMDDPFKNATQKEVEMIEHLVKPKGIDGFWRDVEIFMNYLYQKHPVEMKALEDEAEMIRTQTMNKYAASASLSMRFLGKMPGKLVIMLDRVYNKEYPISQKRFQREFFRRYPKLRVADKI